MKNSTTTFLKKYSKILTLAGVFTCMLFLSAQTFAQQPYARIEQANVHFFDSYAPYGATADTKIVLYADEYATMRWDDYSNPYPTGGFDIIVNTSNEYDQYYYSQYNPPYFIGDTHYYMTSNDTYTITTYDNGMHLWYAYEWLLVFKVVDNPYSASGAEYQSLQTYPSPVNY